MNPKIDWYFDKDEKWQAAVKQLRKVVLDCGLTEEMKWGCPCYTFQNHNIVLIHDFKDYCALLFFKGSLLSDNDKILIQQTENVQAGRQIRFTSTEEIVKKAPIIKAYIYEAIAIEKAGLKVPLKKTAAYTIPEEFQHKMKNNMALKTAFKALTPGRQRGYILYFSAPKQSKTRESRIEKYIPSILSGKGLND